MDCEKVEWSRLVQYRVHWALVNTAMNIQGPQKTGNFLTSWAAVSF
jgi:hypothetical protein